MIKFLIALVLLPYALEGVMVVVVVALVICDPALVFHR
jgi:hypothetical protein